MTRRLLTAAEVIGITGNEPPLTPDDVDAIARRYYSPDRAAAVLTGDRERALDTSCGGGNSEMFFMADQRGLWAHAGNDPRRAGHIPWRDLEAVLHRNATPSAVRALVDASTALRAHVSAWNRAWIEHRYGPGSGEGDPPRYDADTGARLQATAHRALTDLLNGPRQLDLFTEAS
ncbi:hypothetical protein [Actinomadura geliboluensis]|uniref:hypothetical protein n=1 Tax=Actinomadura geliboluensis TaxID=882440 RepID=UPI00368B517D